MNKLMRTALTGLAFLYALAAGTLVYSQGYPTKPIRWIVPLAAGGPNDILTRAIAPQLAASLGQPVIVENRAGAAGITGTEAVAKSAPDGYTLLTTTSGNLVYHKFVYHNLPYDPQRDFAPVTALADSQIGLFVHESVPARTLQEFINYAKANPGKLTYGTSGIGQPFHIATELFLSYTGTAMVHIPYKGAGQFIPDFLAGRVDVLFFPVIDQLVSQKRAGRIRALAVATERRVPALSDVPTFDEAGMPGFRLPAGGIAVVVRTGTPMDIIERLSNGIGNAVASPAFGKLCAENNMIPAASNPEQMARFIKSEIARWGPVITALGIKAD